MPPTVTGCQFDIGAQRGGTSKHSLKHRTLSRGIGGAPLANFDLILLPITALASALLGHASRNA